MHGSGAVFCSCSLLIRGPILPAVRQKLHLSPCADSRSRLLTRDSLQYSGLIKCKFLETTFVKRETTRLKFWCKSNVDSEWMYEIEVVPLRGNKLMIEEVKNQ